MAREQKPATKPSEADDIKQDGAETTLIEELKAATVNLRDCELQLRASQERYRKALEAFNAHVAPVKP